MLPLLFMLNPHRHPFEELTIAQLRANASSKTKKFKAIRQTVKGQESSVAQCVDFQFPGRWLFLTEATHSFQTQIVNYKTMSLKFRQGNVYDPIIEIVDFNKWIDNRYSDVGQKQLLQIIGEADVKVACNCPAFLAQGHARRLTKAGASLFPVTIDDPVWGPRHNDAVAGCKHLTGIFQYITFYSYIMLAKQRDVIKRKGIPKSLRGSAYP